MFNFTRLIDRKTFGSAGMRLSAAGLKFLNVVFLARTLDPAHLGVFGLIVAFAMISVQVVGGEFHAISSREVSSANKEHVSQIICSQFRLHLYFHTVLLPILFISLYLYDVYKSFCVLLPLLIFFEHMAIELSRFLQFRFRPLACATVEFIRAGGWVVVFWIIVWTTNSTPTLNLLLICWVLFSFFAAVVGFVAIRKYVSLNSFLISKSKRSLRYYAPKAFPFFIIAILSGLGLHLDKLLISSNLNVDAVGIYFLFFSIASGLHLFVTFAVNVIWAPIAIKAFRNSGLKGFRNSRSKFLLNTLIFTTIGVVGLLALINPALNFVKNDLYADNLEIFYIFLISNILIIVGEFFDLELYVRNLDKEQLVVAIFQFPLVFGFQFTLILCFGLLGAALATVFSALSLIVLRYVFLRRTLMGQPYLLNNYREKIQHEE